MNNLKNMSHRFHSPRDDRDIAEIPIKLALVKHQSINQSTRWCSYALQKPDFFTFAYYKLHISSLKLRGQFLLCRDVHVFCTDLWTMMMATPHLRVVFLGVFRFSLPTYDRYDHDDILKYCWQKRQPPCFDLYKILEQCIKQLKKYKVYVYKAYKVGGGQGSSGLFQVLRPIPNVRMNFIF